MLKARHTLRWAAASAAALAALLVAAPVAGASTVVVGSNQVVFTATPGTANQVTVSDSGNSFRVSDPASVVVAGVGCSQSGATVLCPQSSISSIRVELGDGNDTLTSTASENLVVRGGAGNDTLNGGGQGDQLNGEDGNDTIVGNDGPDTMDGGAGTDVVSYAAKTQPIRADLDGAYDDGETFEWDNVQPSVEEVVGGAGNDTFVGTAGPNVFRGGPGDDTIDGMDGDDGLYGDAGNDRLDGRAGKDAFGGGDGDDTVLARDNGTGEQVDCGGGADTLTADREDTPTGCENVDVPAASAAAPSAETPAASAPVTNVVSIVERKLILARNGRISIKLTCGAEQVRGCRGTVVLTALLPARRARASRRSGPANKVILAKSKFKLRRGRTKAVRVPAARLAVRRVFTKERKRVNASLAVTMRNPDGSTTQITKPVSVAAPTLRG